MIQDRSIRCGDDWDGRFRCGRTDCGRCRRRQMRRECRAAVERLGKGDFRFVVLTIELGASRDPEHDIATVRAGIRNRLNACRRAYRRWADVKIWGWLRLAMNMSGGVDLTAHAIVRIGPRLGAGDVRAEMCRTWRRPGQVNVGPAAALDALPVLVTSMMARALEPCGRASRHLPTFRAMRFRYGRTQRQPTVAPAPYIEPMPWSFNVFPVRY
jgi:hypothetical protein